MSGFLLESMISATEHLDLDLRYGGLKVVSWPLELDWQAPVRTRAQKSTRTREAYTYNDVDNEETAQSSHQVTNFKDRDQSKEVGTQIAR